MLSHGKFTFVWSVAAPWEQDTSYLAQVPSPVKHSLIWQHRALGKHNTWLSCNNNFTFLLIPVFNQGNFSVGYHHSQNEGIFTFHHIDAQQMSLKAWKRLFHVLIEKKYPSVWKLCFPLKKKKTETLPKKQSTNQTKYPPEFKFTQKNNWNMIQTNHLNCASKMAIALA